jgi:hypothetical protein
LFVIAGLEAAVITRRYCNTPDLVALLPCSSIRNYAVVSAVSPYWHPAGVWAPSTRAQTHHHKQAVPQRFNQSERYRSTSQVLSQR